MANAETLITNTISFLDGVSATDGDNADRRARLLVFLQFIHKLVWNYRGWQFTYKETSFSITSGNSKTLATAIPDFLAFGPQGSLYNEDTKTRMHEASRYIVERMRRESGGSGPSSRHFAVFNNSIHLPYTVSTTTNFVAFHRYRAPNLTDDLTELAMPDQYGDLVLLPGLIWRAQESKSDARETWKAQFKEGLSQMCALERPEQSSNQRLPLAFKGAW